MKVIKEAINNVPETKEAVVAVDPVTAKAKEDSDKIAKERKDMFDTKKLSKSEPITGHNKKDYPKKVVEPKASLDESLFEDVNDTFEYACDDCNYTCEMTPDEYELCGGKCPNCGNHHGNFNMVEEGFEEDTEKVIDNKMNESEGDETDRCRYKYSVKGKEIDVEDAWIRHQLGLPYSCAQYTYDGGYNGTYDNDSPKFARRCKFGAKADEKDTYKKIRKSAFTKDELNEDIYAKGLSPEKQGILEFPSGDYFYVNVDDDTNTLYAGSATNTGVIREFEMPYDDDDSLQGNLENLYDKIIEERPEVLGDGEEEIDEAVEWTVDGEAEAEAQGRALGKAIAVGIAKFIPTKLDDAILTELGGALGAIGGRHVYRRAARNGVGKVNRLPEPDEDVIEADYTVEDESLAEGILKSKATNNAVDDDDDDDTEDDGIEGEHWTKKGEKRAAKEGGAAGAAIGAALGTAIPIPVIDTAILTPVGAALGSIGGRHVYRRSMRKAEQEKIKNEKERAASRKDREDEVKNNQSYEEGYINYTAMAMHQQGLSESIGDMREEAIEGNCVAVCEAYLNLCNELAGKTDDDYIVEGLQFVTQGINLNEAKELDRVELEEDLLDREVYIIEMKGEPTYTGLTGTVRYISEGLQVYGDWGGLALDPSVDEFEIIG